jgi:hypothetical protein
MAGQAAEVTILIQPGKKHDLDAVKAPPNGFHEVKRNKKQFCHLTDAIVLKGSRALP